MKILGRCVRAVDWPIVALLTGVILIASGFVIRYWFRFGLRSTWLVVAGALLLSVQGFLAAGDKQIRLRIAPAIGATCWLACAAILSAEASKLAHETVALRTVLIALALGVAGTIAWRWKTDADFPY